MVMLVFLMLAALAAAAGWFWLSGEVSGSRGCLLYTSFHIAAVYINGIAHRLECIKADAEWQSQAQEGNGRSYYGVDVVDEKVGVFEKEQHAKAADDTEQ